jgi:chromosome transmission fidelity protein 18
VPKEGETRLPMTLADGTRVYIRVRSTETPSQSQSTSTENNHSDTSFARSSLGVSMKELKRRSDAIRRRQGTQRSASRRIVDNGQLWVDKHAPSSFPHLLSDERTNREVLRSLRDWDPYVFGRDPPVRPASHNPPENDKPKEKTNDKRPDEQNRVILLSGPPGVGK